MNILKKAVAPVALLACSVGIALAQSVPPSATTVTTELEGVRDSMYDLMTAALPLIGGIAAAGVLLWAVPKAVSWLKRAFGRS